MKILVGYIARQGQTRGTGSYYAEHPTSPWVPSRAQAKRWKPTEYETARAFAARYGDRVVPLYRRASRCDLCRRPGISHVHHGFAYCPACESSCAPCSATREVAIYRTRPSAPDTPSKRSA